MHSVDFRERVVRAYKNGVGSYEYVGDVFVVGSASVKRWVRLDRETGSVEPRPHGGGCEFFIDDKGLSLLKIFLAEDASASLEELRDRYNRRRRTSVSSSTVGRAIRDRLKITRKKRPIALHNETLRRIRRSAMPS